MNIPSELKLILIGTFISVGLVLAPYLFITALLMAFICAILAVAHDAAGGAASAISSISGGRGGDDV